MMHKGYQSKYLYLGVVKQLTEKGLYIPEECERKDILELCKLHHVKIEYDSICTNKSITKNKLFFLSKLLKEMYRNETEPNRRLRLKHMKDGLDMVLHHEGERFIDNYIVRGEDL